MEPLKERTEARKRTPPAPELAVWEFAGLMLTYWCHARCAFCYVYGGPDRGGNMDCDTAIGLWRSLDRLAAASGKIMRIHLAGGEPFRDWVRLVSIIRAADDAGLTPLEKVETGAFWATDDGLTRARLELLDALGMQKLIVSWDVYHSEFVPFDRVRRCVEIARQVLGRGRVMVRWWDFFQQPVDARQMTAARKEQAFRMALERHKDRLTGRAAEQLARLLPGRPAATFRGQTCLKEALQSKHVHIDPHGNIFPGTCAGIILGRASGRGGAGFRPVEDTADRRGEVGSACHLCGSTADTAVPHGGESLADARLGSPGRTVAQVWHDLAANWRRHPVMDAVVTGGSYELLQRVRPLGYRESPGGYANKCHLCSDLRQFLVDRGEWADFVGPPECYARAPHR